MFNKIKKKLKKKENDVNVATLNLRLQPPPNNNKICSWDKAKLKA
jgi:hypothetical protein